jgi:hypothetical protein
MVDGPVPGLVRKEAVNLMLIKDVHLLLSQGRTGLLNNLVKAGLEDPKHLILLNLPTGPLIVRSRGWAQPLDQGRCFYQVPAMQVDWPPGQLQPRGNVGWLNGFDLIWLALPFLGELSPHLLRDGG